VRSAPSADVAVRLAYALGAALTSLRCAMATGKAEATGIAVFARAPVPGQAKTRLIPRLGAKGAARLHAALVRHALEKRSRPGWTGDLVVRAGRGSSFFTILRA